MSEPTVATMTTRFAELEKKRELCHDLMKGTEGMIAAKQRWLPQHKAEHDDSYKVRLEQTILNNFLAQAIDKASGKIFSKSIVFKEDVPEDIKNLCYNVDRKGRNLSSFMLDRVKKSLEDGITYVLIDSPRIEGEMTAAEAKAKNIRPYSIPINASDMLEITAEFVDGVYTIIRIRYSEIVQVPNGEWGFSSEQRIRLFKRVQIPFEDGTVKVVIQFEVYRQDKDGNWVVVDSGDTTLPMIPLIAIYANQVGFMEGEPVFQTTAELNLEHWRTKSEQLHSLSFGRFAMLGGSGIPADTKIQVGPNQNLFAAQPDSKFYYVESNGVGLEHGWKHLASIEKSVETASAVLRIDNSGRVTATAAAIDSDEINAALKTIALGIQDNIEYLLQMFALLFGLGADNGGSAEINTNFGIQKGSDVGLQEIGKLVTSATPSLSGESAIRNLIWRGELPPDFDITKNTTEVKAIVEERKKALEKTAAQGTNTPAA